MLARHTDDLDFNVLAFRQCAGGLERGRRGFHGSSLLLVLGGKETAKEATVAIIRDRRTSCASGSGGSRRQGLAGLGVDLNRFARVVALIDNSHGLWRISLPLRIVETPLLLTR